MNIFGVGLNNKIEMLSRKMFNRKIWLQINEIWQWWIIILIKIEPSFRQISSKIFFQYHLHTVPWRTIIENNNIERFFVIKRQWNKFCDSIYFDPSYKDELASNFLSLYGKMSLTEKLLFLLHESAWISL